MPRPADWCCDTNPNPTKKPTRLNTLEVFNRVGLLVNGPSTVVVGCPLFSRPTNSELFFDDSAVAIHCSITINMLRSNADKASTVIAFISSGSFVEHWIDLLQPHAKVGFLLAGQVALDELAMKITDAAAVLIRGLRGQAKRCKGCGKRSAGFEGID
jgi:hypothetical protein